MPTVPQELHDRKGSGFTFAFPAYGVRIARAGSVLLSLILLSLPCTVCGSCVFVSGASSALAGWNGGGHEDSVPGGGGLCGV